MRGTVEVNLDGPSVVPVAGSIEVDVEALTSGNPLYDGEMRRRIESRRYPTITGETREIVATGDGKRFRVAGILTFHGVTEELAGEVEVDMSEDGLLRVEGEQVIDVRRFGITPPRIAMLRVHPDVRVSLRVVAERG